MNEPKETSTAPRASAFRPYLSAFVLAVAALVVLVAQNDLANPYDAASAAAAQSSSARFQQFDDDVRLFLPMIPKTPLQLAGPSRGIDAAGGFVYLGDGGHLAVADVSDPESPRLTQLLGPLTPECQVMDVTVDGDRVYALCLESSAELDTPGSKSTVVVLEQATADRPAHVIDTVGLGDMAYKLVAQDGWVYVGGFWCDPDCDDDALSGGLLVVDARTPGQAEYHGRVETETFPVAMLAEASIIYVGGLATPPESSATTRVTVLDAARRHAPEVIAEVSVDEEWSIEDDLKLALHEQQLYVGFAFWVRVLDVKDPAQPSWHVDFELIDENGALDIRSSGDHIFTLAGIDDPHDLLILEPIDPAAAPGTTVEPTIVGRVSLPAPVWIRSLESVLAVDEDYAYVAGGNDGGLYVIDARDPATPRIAGTLWPKSGILP